MKVQAARVDPAVACPAQNLLALFNTRGIENVHKRILLAISWISLISALIALIIGHTGSHDLRWEINQISTYAATAPHDRWITASMILPCLTLVCISILVSKYKILGDNHVAHTVPLCAGATIAGLLTLAAYEETARTMMILRKAGFEAIRQQSFHDAGLLIFFYSAILVAVVLGVLIIAQAAHGKEKILGGAVTLLGMAAFPLMTTAWPRLIGALGAGPGLKQRASLLSIWLATALVLVVASDKVLPRSQPLTRCA